MPHMMTLTTSQTTPHGGHRSPSPTQTTVLSYQHPNPTTVPHITAHTTPSALQSADGAARPGGRPRGDVRITWREPSAKSIVDSSLPTSILDRRRTAPDWTSKTSTLFWSTSFHCVTKDLRPPCASRP